MTTTIQPQLSNLSSDLPLDSLAGPSHPAALEGNVQLLGGKAASLARLYTAGLPMPAFVVVTTSGARAAIGADLWRQLAQETDANQGTHLLGKVALPPALQES